MSKKIGGVRDRAQVESWLRDAEKVRGSIEWTTPTMGVEQFRCQDYVLDYYPNPQKRGVKFSGSKGAEAGQRFQSFLSSGSGSAVGARGGAAVPPPSNGSGKTLTGAANHVAAQQAQQADFHLPRPVSSGAPLGAAAAGAAHQFCSSGFSSASAQLPQPSFGTSNNGAPLQKRSRVAAASERAGDLAEAGGDEVLRGGIYSGLTFRTVKELYPDYAEWLCGEQAERLKAYLRAGTGIGSATSSNALASSSSAASASPSPAAKRQRLAPADEGSAFGTGFTAAAPFGGAPFTAHKPSIDQEDPRGQRFPTLDEVYYDLYLYFDGACPNNQLANACRRAGFGVAVYANVTRKPDRAIASARELELLAEVAGPVADEQRHGEAFWLGAEMQTNNTGELSGFIEALLFLHEMEGKLRQRLLAGGSRRLNALILYDSTYAHGVGTGTQNAIKNVKMVRVAKKALAATRNKLNVDFRKVKGHSGDVGNDRADGLANAAAQSGAFKNSEWCRWTPAPGNKNDLAKRILAEVR